LLESLAPCLAEGAGVTDVASVTQSTVDAALAVFGEVPAQLVPGHPIAGSEQSGYGASRDDLFRGKTVILTPFAHTAPAALEQVRGLWRCLGAEVLGMDVGHHDEVLAATSHLPHLLAFALVDTLSQQGTREEIFRYVAGGFRDFTRIASSDPRMWRDVFLSNGLALARILDRYLEDLQALRRALLDGDAQLLFETCRRARESRAVFLEYNRQA